MRTTILLLVSVFLAGVLSAQTRNMSELKINTSAQCGQCKDRIELAMAYEKGVKKSSLDLETKVLTVLYNPARTTPATIRLAVAKVGYDADDVPADMQAYKALPPCCKKPDDPDYISH